MNAWYIDWVTRLYGVYVSQQNGMGASDVHESCKTTLKKNSSYIVFI